jgi:RNA polymerase sigma factor (sigma-70 family)
VRVPEHELDAWMSRLADGDRAAFEPLFRALWPRAVAVARRRLDPASADDAAQSALMKLFDHAPEFALGSPVLPWFYAIAANEVRALLRSTRAHAGMEAIEAMAARGDPQDAAIEQELRRALACALESLDATSADAIAAVLGDAERPAVESVAFRKRVSRAYARLRVLLGVHHER